MVWFQMPEPQGQEEQIFQFKSEAGKTQRPNLERC